MTTEAEGDSFIFNDEREKTPALLQYLLLLRALSLVLLLHMSMFAFNHTPQAGGALCKELLGSSTSNPPPNHMTKCPAD